MSFDLAKEHLVADPVEFRPLGVRQLLAICFFGQDACHGCRGFAQVVVVVPQELGTDCPVE